MNKQSILETTAWCFFVTPSHPADPGQYLSRSWLDVGHPRVNPTLIQDSSDLWLVDDPSAYALQCVANFIKRLPPRVRDALRLDDVISSQQIVIETCTIVDCNKEKALALRIFDPTYTPRSALPQNYEWRRYLPGGLNNQVQVTGRYGSKPDDASGKCQINDDLIKAAGRGDLARVEKLLNQGADINARDSDGDTPLRHAVGKGHADVVRVLLANKADVHATNNKGATPLHLAALNGKQEVAELLLANHVNVNARNNGDQTPLHNAAIFDHKDVAKLLLTNGADVNAKDGCGHTPWAWATHRGHNDMAILLRKHGGHE